MKVRIECVDENCKGVVTNPYHNGLVCPKCGGPALPTRVAEKEIVVPVKLDMTKALSEIKELTKATDECVVSLSKLEQVMDRFTNKGELKDIQIGIVLDDRVTAESIIRKVNEIDEIKRRF
ncbi:hypothetical protein P4J13_23365 [Bacillus anthracis]|uniref:hypothetical protein n=1 Tax=Bacillus anthracis TaxID=1392 RepID=UPI002DB74D2C|nr:hypothetical protein [Bacillus anthracis]MEB9506876.1 hypothetical protein [Bacillus anthracis]